MSFSAGRSSGAEVSKRPGRSVQFPQTGPAQTGELRGFSPVAKQQTKGHHRTGDQRCSHTGTTED